MQIPSTITSEWLQTLVEGKVHEGTTIDYKQQLGKSRDFSKTISSFANRDGGVILVGIAEGKNDDGKNTGQPEEVVGFPADGLDDARLSLERSYRSNVEPVPTGITIDLVPYDDTKNVLAIRVPRSWQRPHAFTPEGNTSYYRRGIAGDFRMTHTEIMQAFLGATDGIRLLHEAHLQRLSTAPDRLGGAPGRGLAIVMLDVVPLGVVDGSSAVAPSVAKEKGFFGGGHLRPMSAGSSSWNTRYNLDGFQVYLGSENHKPVSTMQSHRNGTISFASRVHSYRQDAGTAWMFSGKYLLEDILYAVRAAVSFYNDNDIAPPYIIFVSFTTCSGVGLVPHGQGFFGSEGVLQDDPAILPESIIFTGDQPIHTALLPTLDAMWQAFGYERCFSLDEHRESEEQP